MIGRTVGLDLAADPRRTAATVVEWGTTSAQIVEVHVGVTDGLGVELMREPADKIGIDAPLGWPEAFVEFVIAHRDGRPAGPDLTHADPHWRRPLANRATDLFVRRETGLVPLSVSTDRIAHVALRCAALLGQSGGAVDRAGAGVVAEVYPAATLLRWHLPHRGYKGDGRRDDRARALARLFLLAPWLEAGAHEHRFVESDDAFDSLVCALTARAVAVGATVPPPDAELARRARHEGWIHLPTTPPYQLLGREGGAP